MIEDSPYPVDEQGRLKVVIDDVTPDGAKAMRDVSKVKDVGKVVKRSRKAVVRAKDGELRQEDVAKDFGVTRQTVNKWEHEQTEDGPNNKKNPYGYYRALRIDPNLRGAYDQLVNSVKPYLAAKVEAKKKGVRFRMTFVRFNEFMLEHNQKK